MGMAVLSHYDQARRFAADAACERALKEGLIQLYGVAGLYGSAGRRGHSVSIYD